ncbi:MAG TPA: oligosaccharide flippase family protein [Microbacteriaceae bacterium]|nr:oligosaccharide flippase family protein [Microbacteriaceae bacterium]
MVPSRRAARTVPVVFRFWALASRFLLVFFLARYLPPAEVGLYGLVAATIAYVVYVLGMDMYTYTTREVIKSEPTGWRKHLASHSAFLGCVAVVVVPLLALLFALGLLPWQVAVWFFLIAVSEHVGMEIDRLLVSMSDQFGASLVILVRQAALPTVAIPLLILVPGLRHLELVFTGWFVFNAIAILLGVCLLLRRAPASGRISIDWAWIRRGIAVSIPFLIGTLCLRLLFTADRQVVALLENLDVLAAYTLAMSIASGVSSVLAVGVHQFVYPRLVRSASQRDGRSFQSGVRSLWGQTIIVAAGSLLVVLVTYEWIATWFGHEIYVEYGWLLPVAVAVVGVYNLSLVPHFALYALHADRSILVVTIGAVLAFVAVVPLSLATGATVVVGVITAVGAASLVLFGGKYWAYRRRVSAEGSWLA